MISSMKLLTLPFNLILGLKKKQAIPRPHKTSILVEAMSPSAIWEIPGDTQQGDLYKIRPPGDFVHKSMAKLLM